MLNMWSAAGRQLVFNAISPKFADLLPGLTYSLVLVNSSSSDITTGTITIETADAKVDSPCEPDVWAPLDAVPTCDALPGTVAGAAKIVLSAQNPLKAYTQCGYAFPCPNQFLRVSGVPTGVDAIVIVDRLRRTETSYGDTRGNIVQQVRPGA